MKDTRISIRFPDDVLVALQQLAKQHDRSFNGEVVWAVRQFIRACQQESTEHGRDTDHHAQDPAAPDA